MADADAKFRDELDLVLGHRGAISNTRINAILDIAFDFTYVNQIISFFLPFHLPF